MRGRSDHVEGVHLAIRRSLLEYDVTVLVHSFILINRLSSELRCFLSTRKKELLRRVCERMKHPFEVVESIGQTPVPIDHPEQSK